MAYDLSRSRAERNLPPTTDFKVEKNKARALDILPDFAEKQAKHEADKALSIDWQPIFSRIKIKPDPETMHGLLDIPDDRQALARGTIVAIGPEVGWRDGKQIVKFHVGQRVLYMAQHIQTYKGANGVVHHFLKEHNADVNSIIAIEPGETTND